MYFFPFRIVNIPKKIHICVLGSGKDTQICITELFLFPFLTDTIITEQNKSNIKIIDFKK
jgi:hypothetical protein